jgi:hypothetical protein
MARWKGATTKQRGYAGPHQKLRAQWKPAVDEGQAFCHAASLHSRNEHLVRLIHSIRDDKGRGTPKARLTTFIEYLAAFLSGRATG